MGFSEVRLHIPGNQTATLPKSVEKIERGTDHGN